MFHECLLADQQLGELTLNNGSFGENGYDNQIDHNGDFIFGCRPRSGEQVTHHGSEGSFFQRIRNQAQAQMKTKQQLKPIGDGEFEQR
jgi:hypothetical protein